MIQFSWWKSKSAQRDAMTSEQRPVRKFNVLGRPLYVRMDAPRSKAHAEAAGARSWWQDLLQHPDLAVMTQRELADLPMPRLATPAVDRPGSPQAKGPDRSGSGSTSM